MRYLLPLLILLALTSCRFSSSDQNARSEKIEHPDIVLEEATYKLSQQNDSPIVLSGDKITFYSKDHKAVLENFSFTQEDENGEIKLRGSADYGTVDTYNETLNLTGNVILKEYSGGMEFASSSVFIDTKREEITSDESVVVKSKEGTFEGKGFKGDMKRKVYTFTSLERGVIEI